MLSCRYCFISEYQFHLLSTTLAEMKIYSATAVGIEYGKTIGFCRTSAKASLLNHVLLENRNNH